MPVRFTWRALSCAFSPMSWIGATDDNRCKLAKSKLVLTPEAVTKPLPKSSATVTLALGCEYMQLISFPPTCRFFSNYFGRVLWCHQIHKLHKSRQHTSLDERLHFEGSCTGNQTHCSVLLSPGSGIKPRPWLPVVVKHPATVLLKTNGINIILWPNLNMNVSPPGSPWRFIWKDFPCLKLSHL